MSFKLLPLLILAIIYSAAQGSPSGARIPLSSLSPYPSLLQKQPKNDESGPLVVFQTSENDVHSIPARTMEDADSQAQPIMFSEKVDSG
uniref:Uncharacterized protein n=1 Tax=Ditylenchus dipsaci TaxID=166011 RepID=A0A915DQA5_9BILA